jgi:flagellar hook-length control protein FliK
MNVSIGQEEAPPEMPVLPSRPPVMLTPEASSGNAAASQESQAAPEPPAPAPLQDPQPAPAPRIPLPVQEGTADPVLGPKPEETPAVKPPAQSAAVQTNPASIAATVQAMIASVQVESSTPEAGRPGSVPVRAADPSVSRGFFERTGPSKPSEHFAPRTRERVEFVERIVRGAKLAKARGHARMRIVLQPPHLGRMKVHLVVKDHVLHGTIQADQAATRELMLSHMQSLKEALEQQGVQVGDFHVDVEQGTEQPAHDFHRESEDGTSSQPFGGPESGQAESAGDEGAVRPRSTRLQLLDLVA